MRIKPDASFVCGKYHFIREGCVELQALAMRKGERVALSGEAVFCTLASLLGLSPLCGSPVTSKDHKG